MQKYTVCLTTTANVFAFIDVLSDHQDDAIAQAKKFVSQSDWQLAIVSLENLTNTTALITSAPIPSPTKGTQDV